MVLAYLRERDNVRRLKFWIQAQDSYYVDGQGTDWRIFSDFAVPLVTRIMISG